MPCQNETGVTISNILFEIYWVNFFPDIHYMIEMHQMMLFKKKIRRQLTSFLLIICWNNHREFHRILRLEFPEGKLSSLFLGFTREKFLLLVIADNLRIWCGAEIDGNAYLWTAMSACYKVYMNIACLYPQHMGAMLSLAWGMVKPISSQVM